LMEDHQVVFLFSEFFANLPHDYDEIIGVENYDALAALLDSLQIELVAVVSASAVGGLMRSPCLNSIWIAYVS
jgi:hypothetical protein